MKFLTDKKFLLFTAKFLLVFLFLYYGTLAMIGLAAPGKYYSPFVAAHLDYVSWIKISLLKGTKFLLSLFGIHTELMPGFILRIVHGRSIVVAMSCVGYGVYSFWIAFVVANSAPVVKKICWIFFGVLLLWLINVIRISLFLVAFDRGWPMPLGIDHHTWFTIWAYIAIFIMIWFFERSLKRSAIKTHIHADRPVDL